MHIDRDSLEARANAFSVPRYGVRVTDRALRDWVEDGLVPGPTGRGRGKKRGKAQDWTPLAYRRVLQTCRLIQRGVTRRSAQIVTLWLGGADFPHERVRDALVREYVRLRKKGQRSLPVGWDAYADPVPKTPRQRQAVERALGLESLVTGVAPNGAAMDTLLSLVAGGLSGEPTRLDPMQASEVILAPLGLGDMAMKDDFVRFTANDDIRIEEAMAGLIANPEEMARPERATEEMIAHASDELLRNVRDFVRALPWMFAAMATIAALIIPEITADTFRAAVNGPSTLDDTERRLALFGLFLHRAVLKGDEGRGMGAAARVGVPELRRQGIANLYTQAKEQIEAQKSDT